MDGGINTAADVGATTSGSGNKAGNRVGAIGSN